MFAMKHPVLTSHDNYIDGEENDDGQGTAKDKYSSESRYVQRVTVHLAIKCFFTIFPVCKKLFFDCISCVFPLYFRYFDSTLRPFSLF
jgi:hypothetical protein